MGTQGQQENSHFIVPCINFLNNNQFQERPYEHGVE